MFKRTPTAVQLNSSKHGNLARIPRESCSESLHLGWRPGKLPFSASKILTLKSQDHTSVDKFSCVSLCFSLRSSLSLLFATNVFSPI